MNLTYVLCTLAQNVLTLFLLVLISMLVRPPHRPWDGLIQAINRNQLCVFLAVRYLHNPRLRRRAFSHSGLYGQQSYSRDQPVHAGQPDGGSGELLHEDALRQRFR
jgi:hypothetical protein